MKILLDIYRHLRILIKQIIGMEPTISIDLKIAKEFHGNECCGWYIPKDKLNTQSVIIDIGLGEDISFSTSIINRYKCTVYGFDPTPKAIAYVEKIADPNFRLYKFAVSEKEGKTKFYLPNNQAYVSGTLTPTNHTGLYEIEVELVTLQNIMAIISNDHIDLLKIDIEGAEYELLLSSSFESIAKKINILCIEFHHRWPEFGVEYTKKAVNRLSELGFKCIWINRTTNEEFTFIRI